MSGYVDAGYALSLSTLALYALWVARRRRSLSRALAAAPVRPADDR